MAVPEAPRDDSRETTVTESVKAECIPLAPHREMLRNVDDVLSSFAFLATSSWSLRIQKEVKSGP